MWEICPGLMFLKLMSSILLTHSFLSIENKHSTLLEASIFIFVYIYLSIYKLYIFIKVNINFYSHVETQWIYFEVGKRILS